MRVCVCVCVHWFAGISWGQNNTFTKIQTQQLCKTQRRKNIAAGVFQGVEGPVRALLSVCVPVCRYACLCVCVCSCRCVQVEAVQYMHMCIIRINHSKLSIAFMLCVCVCVCVCRVCEAAGVLSQFVRLCRCHPPSGNVHWSFCTTQN